MRILLLGATGRVGKQILNLLLEENYEVTVLVRDQQKLTIQHPLLKIFQGDVLQSEDIRKSIEGIDGVISALNTNENETLSKSMQILVPLLEEFHIQRIVTIGTAGILQSRVEPNTLRYLSSESKRKSKTAASDHEKVFHLLNGSRLNWTIVCPTYLPDGPITKNYRVSENFLPADGKSISTGDTANFAVKEFFEEKFIQYRVGICY
ncbi:NAD(P)-dependent oxidoreductase [Gottfriedia solisilvae]|uniref:NAD(P)-dependent oxidoreductase n=1 Tax=Gottfriedia solisilvae TaxID=1516104 RepID=UPI003D2F3A90